jgi:integrase
VKHFFQDVADGKTAAPEPAEGEKRKRGGVVRGGIAAAHRSTEMLGSILQYAIGEKIISLNPVFLFGRTKQKTLKPPFSVEAVTKVGRAMRDLEAEGEPAVGIRVARHLLLTGFRRMEALTLKWGKVDAAAHCSRLEDTKTGPQIRPLGQAALDHLASFRPKDARPGDYVFPGSGKAGHYVGAPKAWKRIATRAGIEGVPPHGLRHWFASAGAELGYSDIVIGAIIGHAKHGITGRYATAPDAVLIAAANRISQHLADALNGKEAGKVIKLPMAG